MKRNRLEQLSLEQQIFDVVVTSRIVLLYSGLDLEPSYDMTYKLSVIVGFESVEELNGVTELNGVRWPIYHCHPDAEDPMECVWLAPWLVHSVLALKEDDDFDFSSIDPMDWVNRIDAKVEQLPPGLVDESTAEVLKQFKATMNEDRGLHFVRDCLRRKQDAVLAKKGIAPSTTTRQ